MKEFSRFAADQPSPGSSSGLSRPPSSADGTQSGSGSGRHDDAWGRAVAGDTALVLVVGEAGIGKSRFVEEFPGTDADRMPVLSVQGDPYRQDESFGVLAEALADSTPSVNDVVSGIAGSLHDGERRE